MALDLEKEVNYLTSPEHIQNLRNQVASNAMTGGANLRKATATHFGVPEEEVDDQMIEMYRSIPPEDELKDEVV